MIQMSIGGERSVVSVLGSSYWIMLTNFHLSKAKKKILSARLFNAVYFLTTATSEAKQIALSERHHKISKENNIFCCAPFHSMEMLSCSWSYFSLYKLHIYLSIKLLKYFIDFLKISDSIWIFCRWISTIITIIFLRNRLA
jgi:hypothetical protein